ncbi:MAG TPA: glycosyltransferase family 4 protein [Gemmatimonadaceae bacterium]|nr:glycosyltransferase family 4 protein [Gemmatimonadaceae bacterium]
MRILQVARQFHPKIGGIESCVLNLSRGLIERGHHVEVVTLDRDLKNGRLLDSSARIDSIPVHRISYLGSRRYPIAPSWLRFTDDFDVVHIHAIDFFVDSAALGKSLGLQRKPFVVTTHGGIFHTPAWLPLKRLYWRHVLSRSLGAADAVVADCDNDASLFRSIVPPHKLVTIPNGIDSLFAETQAARVRGRIVCVGRVTEGKAIDKIIQLLPKVANEFPDLELVIAGPDENGATERLLRTAAAVGLQSKVRTVGELPLPELAQLVASAHLLVSAAPHEGFGITTVEALSAGVPVLVTRTGIHDEIVQPGVNGWFWSGLPDETAAATLRKALLLPDARLDEMRLAARNSATPFDWKLTTEKYERVFESAHRKTLG